jgi:hypothetical protein
MGAQTLGEVAGVSTAVPSNDGSNTPPSYDLSYADVSFAQTEWEQVSDPEFGVSFEYPKNATQWVRTAGSSNTTVVRKGNPLFRLNRAETDLSLPAWMEQNKADYADYQLTQTTFKGLPAWTATLSTADRGDTYFFVKNGGKVLTISSANAAKGSDEEQWADHILQTLKLLPL